MSTRIRLSLAPGQRGTKALLRIYGDRLLRVRYRYDDQTGRRLKTAEIVVAEVPWRKRPIPDDRVVGLRIGHQETELRLKAKGAGATYDARRGLWLLPYRDVRGLGLETRVTP